MSLKAGHGAIPYLLAIGLTMSAMSAAAHGQGPPITQDVVYRIHADPDDANSAVTFAVWLKLEQADVDGDSAGWDITSIRFRLVGEGGQPDTLWTVSEPNVPTSDGLWWVTHADPEDPQLCEFATPPHLTGTAPANESSDPDLNYDFEAGNYTTPPGGDPWDVTTGLSYSFTQVGDEDPVEAGEDEPVEVAEDDGANA